MQSPDPRRQIHRTFHTWACEMLSNSFLPVCRVRKNWSNHKAIPLLCSCSQSWNYWNIIWFIVGMLLGGHPEESERTIGVLACNIPVSGIGHNGELLGLCSLWAGLCIHVLNSYVTRFVEDYWLDLYQWWKVNSSKYFWIFCQKYPRKASRWAAINVGEFDSQADRTSDFVIKVLSATSSQTWTLKACSTIIQQRNLVIIKQTLTAPIFTDFCTILAFLVLDGVAYIHNVANSALLIHQSWSCRCEIGLLPEEFLEFSIHQKCAHYKYI